MAGVETFTVVWQRYVSRLASLSAVLDERSAAGELLGRISREMVGIQKELAGKGPTKARTHWADSDTLVVVLGGGFTAAEQTLFDPSSTVGGHAFAVRAGFQSAI